MRKSIGLLALSASVLAGCSATSQQASSERMEMRAFEVPPETTQDVQRALRASFSLGDNKSVGNVGIIAPGKLVVMAPANLQDSIAASLKQIVKMPASAGEKPLQLSLHFWSIDATSGSGSDAVPTELTDALAQVRATLGDVHFSLHDQIAGIAGTGQPVEQTWRNPNVPGEGVNNLQYTVSGSGDSLSMTFRFNSQNQMAAGNGLAAGYQNTGLSTTLPLKLGQTVILSQTPMSTSDAAKVATRMLLIRADAVK